MSANTGAGAGSAEWMPFPDAASGSQSEGFGLDSPDGQGSGGFGMSSPDGQGSGGFGMSSPDGQGSGGFGMSSPDGQGSGGFGMSGPDGQGSGGFGISGPGGRGWGYVRNGNSRAVPYIPPAFYHRIRWENRGLGYLPDQSDSRDHPVFSEREEANLKKFQDKLKKAVGNRKGFPEEYASPFDPDYLDKAYGLCRKWASKPLTDKDYQKEIDHFADHKDSVNFGDTYHLSAVEDQDGIASCTAHAVIALAEYLIKAGTYESLDLSRLFLYKSTRDLMGVSGDAGGYIRTTIQALAAFGVPTEDWWAYNPKCLDCEPPIIPYLVAQKFKDVSYKRIDSYGFSSQAVHVLLLHLLAAGFPVAFGFPVFRSISAANRAPYVIPVPAPAPLDKLVGGHAVLAVGYDMKVPYDYWSVKEKKFVRGNGALIIKNSWGEKWADGGFAYLPFKYVLDGLALDFWTIFNPSWITEEPFSDPATT